MKLLGMDHYSIPLTVKEARTKFSKEDENRVKNWVDKKIYEKAADPKMVFRNSLSCKYIPAEEYKGACMLTTMT